MADGNGRKRPGGASAARPRGRSGTRKNDAKIKLKLGTKHERTLEPNSTQSNKPR